MFFRCRHDTNKENGNDVHALQNIYRSEEVKIEKIENNNKNNKNRVGFSILLITRNYI